jgi:hypothetical protein
VRGKSPLAKAVGRFHPDLSANLQPIVLFNSRSPRPGERDGEDYHFRARDQIENFRLQLLREPGRTDNGLLVVKDNDQRVVNVFRLRDLSPTVPVWTRRGAGNRATLGSRFRTASRRP